MQSRSFFSTVGRSLPGVVAFIVTLFVLPSPYSVVALIFMYQFWKEFNKNQNYRAAWPWFVAIILTFCYGLCDVTELRMIAAGICLLVAFAPELWRDFHNRSQEEN